MFLLHANSQSVFTRRSRARMLLQSNCTFEDLSCNLFFKFSSLKYHEVKIFVTKTDKPWFKHSEGHPDYDEMLTFL